MRDAIGKTKTELHENIIKAREATSIVKYHLPTGEWTRYREYFINERNKRRRQYQTTPAYSPLDSSPTSMEGFTTINTTVTDPQARLLNLGPSFAPPRKSTKTLQLEVKAALLVFRNRLIDQITYSQGSRPASLLNGCPFPRRRSQYVPPVTPLIDAKMAILWKSLEPHVKSACTRLRTDTRLWNCIDTIRDNHSIRISVGDKCGGFVVIDRDTDKDLAMEHLSDTSTYQPATYSDFTDSIKDLKVAWTTVAGLGQIPKTTQERINVPTHPRTPVLYPVIKTHKMDIQKGSYPIRPIISGCGGPTDAISWLLVQIITPLLDKIPAHIRNVGEFLTKLDEFDTSSLEDVNYESFDVTALYTNVSNDAAVKATINMLRRHGIKLPYALKLAHIEMLLSACLRCNTFRFADKYFRQCRGLAMGNRLAPILAVTYMHSLERECISRDGRLFYVRYIDDIFIVSTRERVQTTFEKLNRIDDFIKFTKESPSDTGKLPFLNTEVWYDKESGKFRRIWYRKPMKKNLIIPSSSTHPSSIKSGVRKQMVQQAIACSDVESRKEAKSRAKLLIRERTHPQTRNFTNRLPRWGFTEGAVLAIPYIDDRFTYHVRRALETAEIHCRLVTVPPPNLKSLITSTQYHETPPGCPQEDGNCIICNTTGKEGSCNAAGTVYLITCQCGEHYVGETSRPLHARIKEHRDHVRLNRNHWSAHKERAHAEENYKLQSVHILAREREQAKRKAKESIFIASIDPSINGKDEQEMGRSFTFSLSRTHID